MPGLRHLAFVLASTSISVSREPPLLLTLLSCSGFPLDTLLPDVEYYDDPLIGVPLTVFRPAAGPVASFANRTFRLCVGFASADLP